MRFVALYAGLAVALGGCSLLTTANSSGSAVLAQATPTGQVAYDVVKVDDGVVKTVLAHTPQPFHERFKQYQPPPEQKIAVGDILSVVIWESSSEGLFGYSLWDTVNPQGLPLAAAYAALSDIATPAIGPVSASNAGAAGSGTAAGLSAEAGTATGLSAALGGAASATTQTSDLGALAGGAAQGLMTNSGAAAQSSSSTLAAAAAASGIQLPNSVATLAATGQLPGADAAALAQALQQTAPASGMPRLPSSLQELAQTGRPGTRVPTQQVSADGAITIPYGGRIPVVGRTPVEVERAIEQRLAGKAIDPQVLVVLQGSPANSVTVAGEVIGGKRVPLNPGGERLLDVIAAAGGAHAPVHETFVDLSRDGVTASVPLAILVDHPDENIFARPGDVLTLVKRPQTFSVFGATGKNAAITFDRDRLSLSEALAKSGGLLDDQADPRAIFLFRYEPDSTVKALGQPLAAETPRGVSPVAYRFDLKDPKTYLLAKEFPVRDKDIVFVANAEIQPVYRFFTALQNVTGPVVSGFLVCQSGSC